MKKFVSMVLYFVIIAVFVGCSNASTFSNAGNKKFKQGHYEEAAKDFQKAIKKNPNQADYYIEYGMTLISLAKYEEAIKEFDSVYRKSSTSIVKENNKRALRGKGIAYYMMKEYDKALVEFEKSIDMDVLPKLNVDILFYVGSAYSKLGSYQKAADTYTLIIKQGKYAQAYGGRAACYQNMDQYEESLSDLDRAISIKPKNYEYYFDKYNLFKVYGKDAEAKKVLKEASKLKAKSKEEEYSLSKILFFQGDYKTAQKKLEQSLLDGMEEANYYIGEIYRIKKDDQKALQYYEKYIQSGKVTFGDVYNQAAMCLMKTEEYKKALKYLERGIGISDKISSKILKKNQIIIYEHIGDFKKADKLMKSYLEEYPKDKDAIREAGFIETRIG